MATAAAAAATATAAQQMMCVPGTGWVSGAQRADSAPDCTFGPALQWLSHACLDAPCHVTHTHTHTHKHPLPTRRPRYHTHTHTHAITPGLHVDPDITHTLAGGPAAGWDPDM